MPGYLCLTGQADNGSGIRSEVCDIEVHVRKQGVTAQLVTPVGVRAVQLAEGEQVCRVAKLDKAVENEKFSIGGVWDVSEDESPGIPRRVANALMKRQNVTVMVTGLHTGKTDVVRRTMEEVVQALSGHIDVAAKLAFAEASTLSPYTSLALRPAPATAFIRESEQVQYFVTPRSSGSPQHSPKSTARAKRAEGSPRAAPHKRRTTTTLPSLQGAESDAARLVMSPLHFSLPPALKKQSLFPCSDEGNAALSNASPLTSPRRKSRSWVPSRQGSPQRKRKPAKDDGVSSADEDSAGEERSGQAMWRVVKRIVERMPSESEDDSDNPYVFPMAPGKPNEDEAADASAISLPDNQPFLSPSSFSAAGTLPNDASPARGPSSRWDLASDHSPQCFEKTPECLGLVKRPMPPVRTVQNRSIAARRLLQGDDTAGKSAPVSPRRHASPKAARRQESPNQANDPFIPSNASTRGLSAVDLPLSPPSKSLSPFLPQLSPEQQSHLIARSPRSRRKSCVSFEETTVLSRCSSIRSMARMKRKNAAAEIIMDDLRSAEEAVSRRNRLLVLRFDGDSLLRFPKLSWLPKAMRDTLRVKMWICLLETDRRMTLLDVQDARIDPQYACCLSITLDGVEAPGDEGRWSGEGPAITVFMRDSRGKQLTVSTRAHRLFDGDWHSITIDVAPRASDAELRVKCTVDGTVLTSEVSKGGGDLGDEAPPAKRNPGEKRPSDDFDLAGVLSGLDGFDAWHPVAYIGGAVGLIKPNDPLPSIRCVNSLGALLTDVSFWSLAPQPTGNAAKSDGSSECLPGQKVCFARYPLCDEPKTPVAAHRASRLADDVSGKVAHVARPAWVVSQMPQTSLFFEGDSCVVVGPLPGLGSLLGYFSISLWVRTTYTEATMAALKLSDSHTRQKIGVSLHRDIDGVYCPASLCFEVSDVTGKFFIAEVKDAGIADGEWHFIHWTYYYGTSDIVIDDAVVHEVITSVDFFGEPESFADFTAPLVLGGHGFKGKEVREPWHGFLRAVEIAVERVPFARWGLDDGPGGVLLKEQLQGFDGEHVSLKDGSFDDLKKVSCSWLPVEQPSDIRKAVCELVQKKEWTDVKNFDNNEVRAACISVDFEVDSRNNAREVATDVYRGKQIELDRTALSPDPSGDDLLSAEEDGRRAKPADGRFPSLYLPASVWVQLSDSAAVSAFFAHTLAAVADPRPPHKPASPGTPAATPPARQQPPGTENPRGKKGILRRPRADPELPPEAPDRQRPGEKAAGLGKARAAAGGGNVLWLLSLGDAVLCVGHVADNEVHPNCVYDGAAHSWRGPVSSFRAGHKVATSRSQCAAGVEQLLVAAGVRPDLFAKIHAFSPEVFPADAGKMSAAEPAAVFRPVHFEQPPAETAAEGGSPEPEEDPAAKRRVDSFTRTAALDRLLAATRRHAPGGGRGARAAMFAGLLFPFVYQSSALQYVWLHACGKGAGGTVPAQDAIYSLRILDAAARSTEAAACVLIQRRARRFIAARRRNRKPAAPFIPSFLSLPAAQPTPPPRRAASTARSPPDARTATASHPAALPYHLPAPPATTVPMVLDAQRPSEPGKGLAALLVASYQPDDLAIDPSPDLGYHTLLLQRTLVRAGYTVTVLHSKSSDSRDRPRGIHLVTRVDKWMREVNETSAFCFVWLSGKGSLAKNAVEAPQAGEVQGWLAGDEHAARGELLLAAWEAARAVWFEERSARLRALAAPPLQQQQQQQSHDRRRPPNRAREPDMTLSRAARQAQARQEEAQRKSNKAAWRSTLDTLGAAVERVFRAELCSLEQRSRRSIRCALETCFEWVQRYRAPDADPHILLDNAAVPFKKEDAPYNTLSCAKVQRLIAQRLTKPSSLFVSDIVGWRGEAGAYSLNLSFSAAPSSGTCIARRSGRYQLDRFSGAAPAMLATVYLTRGLSGVAGGARLAFLPKAGGQPAGVTAKELVDYTVRRLNKRREKATVSVENPALKDKFTAWGAELATSRMPTTPADLRASKIHRFDSFAEQSLTSCGNPQYFYAALSFAMGVDLSAPAPWQTAENMLKHHLGRAGVLSTKGRVPLPFVDVEVKEPYARLSFGFPRIAADIATFTRPLNVTVTIRPAGTWQQLETRLSSGGRDSFYPVKSAARPESAVIRVALPMDSADKAAYRDPRWLAVLDDSDVDLADLKQLTRGVSRWVAAVTSARQSALGGSLDVAGLRQPAVVVALSDVLGVHKLVKSQRYGMLSGPGVVCDSLAAFVGPEEDRLQSLLHDYGA
ncbi:hypothetical protein DIPPA_12271 [Diplonema papillatum]|nr:hypothetical protein DIPPA_12271 [Diplonema papillatum]